MKNCDSKMMVNCNCIRCWSLSTMSQKVSFLIFSCTKLFVGQPEHVLTCSCGNQIRPSNWHDTTAYQTNISIFGKFRSLHCAGKNNDDWYWYSINTDIYWVSTLTLNELFDLLHNKDSPYYVVIACLLILTVWIILIVNVMKYTCKPTRISYIH